MEAALSSQAEARSMEAAAATARRELAALKARHETCLELLGEAAERNDDLADQLGDIKTAYRAQIESLIGAEIKGPRAWLGEGGQQLRGFMRLLRAPQSSRAKVRGGGAGARPGPFAWLRGAGTKRPDTRPETAPTAPTAPEPTAETGRVAAEEPPTGEATVADGEPAPAQY